MTGISLRYELSQNNVIVYNFCKSKCSLLSFSTIRDKIFRIIIKLFQDQNAIGYALDSLWNSLHEKSVNEKTVDLRKRQFA